MSGPDAAERPESMSGADAERPEPMSGPYPARREGSAAGTQLQGRIIKGVGGLYDVHVQGKGILECKARGIFRKDRRKPLVGDDVCLEELPERGKGVITELLERKSQLIRPAVANIEQALVVFAVAKPQPDFNLLDRFLIMLQQQKLTCTICFNKLDIGGEELAERYRAIYETAGFRVLAVSALERKGIDELWKVLEGHTTAMAGPSGVGKSSLINCLQSGVVMETGEISRKIERGRHTTRHTQLIALDGRSYLLDTPGFSSLELFDLEKEELASYYPEFAKFGQTCRFGGCSHTAEPDCSVKEALGRGEISRIRYENYCLLYQELKNRRKY